MNDPGPDGRQARMKIAYLHDRVWSWDLLAVAITIVGVKLAAVAWYRITD